MNLLIMGGTQFVGRAMAESALARDHEVTLFHRGQTNPELFTGRCEQILGDRKVDLSGLAGRSWDAVIDCVGYEPGVVAATCAAVQTERFAFISTISVYGGPYATEDSPTLPMPEGAPLEGVTPETYGPLKVLCEEEIRNAFPQHVIIRAGLQMGQHDHTDRFNDWVDRMLHRPRVVVPDDGMPWQQIDALDTAAFTLSLLEWDEFGTFNVTGPNRPMVDWLAEVRDLVAPSTELVHVSAEQALAHAAAWQEITLWSPVADREKSPIPVSIERALAAGLTFRPFADTVGEIKAAVLAADPARTRRSGLPLEKELAILAALG